MPSPSRRDLLQASALSAAGLWLPRRLLARPTSTDRKFLFVFCPGGWDQVQVFAPVFADGVDREFESEAAEVNGIPFVDAESRPFVRAFFETWGGRTALVNGLQVRSIAHEICRRLILTGISSPTKDCWPSLLGANATGDPPMPNLHFSGPLFPYRYPEATVRVGSAGQLPALLDGRATGLADRHWDLPSSDIQALENAAVSARVSAWGTSNPRSMAEALANAELVALSRAETLAALGDQLALDAGTSFVDQAAAAANCMELGLARSAVVAFEGYLSMGWDSHAQNYFQDRHFDELFAGLSEILADLESRPGLVEPTLLDETTVVVLSEMGRVPSLNSAQGKEHWTWTAAMIIGSGVRGGQAVGAWTDSVTGESVNLASGEVDPDGETMMPGHLGATLLRLADIDPAEYISDGEAITAVLADP